jgi:hypothetical protein
MTFEQSMTEALQKVVTERVAKIVEDEIKGVQLVVEKRIRAEVGSIAARAFSNFSISRLGQDFVIRVQFDGAAKEGL